MDFLKNFVNHMVTSMPIVTKVAYVNSQLKNYMRTLDRDEIFQDKFIRILQMFISKQITVEDIYNIMDAVDGIKLSHGQINYFVQRVYSNKYIVSILENYIKNKHLYDDEVNDLSEFLVHEINNALIYG
ncbi:hypothetical protein [Rachiplusia nu nucleopolyhedrovirus]|uniref:Ac75-like protein n=1 Tax=Rachiplusia nu nucleopolyhedrovirus TaxID=2605775 RepID=A0AAF1DB32_9ABAC|nr:hypothetical protein QKQ55_gp056 [Rachiplusia nu nucleopolyhedrovirus]QEI03602.1 hypothetical protein [Rachiplusia nu nucleopolyhedrovirus]